MNGTTTLTAAEVMTRKVITIDEDASIREAAMLLLDHGISGAPVKDEFGRIIGLISLRDIARFERERTGTRVEELPYGCVQGPRLPFGFHLDNEDEAAVRQFMTPILITVRDQAPVREVIQTLIERAVHRVLVRNVEGDIVGLISALDILHSLLAEPSAATLATIP
jgi:CBS-domain-containing membrane protein